MLECNRLAVDIYQRCDLSFIGMNCHCAGVSTAAVMDAMKLYKHRLPKDPEEELALFDAIVYLGSVAASVLNSKRKEGR